MKLISTLSRSAIYLTICGASSIPASGLDTFATLLPQNVNGVHKFRDAGYANVIYSPFGCNTEYYVKKSIPKLYDVTFVGQRHPYRAWCIQKLRKAGVRVQSWGAGWNTKTLISPRMIEVFNQSRINLNLSNSVSWDVRYMTALGRPLKDSLRIWWNVIHSSRRPDRKVCEQVKGRHFEINSCGGFQLSYYVEGLERHYRIGEEIAVYESVDQMIEKVRYYLRHEEEREEIAQRGYERTLREHRMEQRFQRIFDRLKHDAKV